MAEKEGIESIEELMKFVAGFEKIATRQFRRINIQDESAYEKLWEMSVLRNMNRLTRNSPDDVTQKWEEIQEERKSAWIEEFKAFNQPDDPSKDSSKSR